LLPPRVARAAGVQAQLRLNTLIHSKETFMTLSFETTPVALTKLTPAAQNVRRTAREAGVAELAASIAAHGLLNPLTIITIHDDKGEPTGKYGVVAGGRRLAALKLLAKQKALPKAAPIPCVIADATHAEELSLTENLNQVAMHPADQFEAFAALQAQGLSADDIAARFGLPARIVQQRLRLGAASPKILAAYRDGILNLDQVMAFCLTDDHARQEELFDCLSPYHGNPSHIRRTLTESQVSLNDRRARFIGPEAYEAAGGTITRDLFSGEDEGYCDDAALLDRLVQDKLAHIADDIRAEGWRWIEVMPEYDYAVTGAMRRIYPQSRALTDEEAETLTLLETEYECLPEDHPEFDAEIERLETAIEALRGPDSFAADDIARAGVFVSLGHDGYARIERGFIRPEDETEHADAEYVEDESGGDHGAAAFLPASLIADLSAWRTVALRDSLAANPDLAYLAVVHALAASIFYPCQPSPSCLELRTSSASLTPHATGIKDSLAQQALDDCHEAWRKRLPENAGDLWTFVASLDTAECAALLAHCAALTINALVLPHQHRASAPHADQLAAHLPLDMTSYWQPTSERFLGRITKPLILQTVSEAVDATAAQRIAHLKKPEMAKAAEHLLSGTGWLPAPLRSRDPDRQGTA
jgi:ParB family chromosome partitioning protein